MTIGLENGTVMRAFRIYTLLARDNAVGKEWLQEYMADDVVRGLSGSIRKRSRLCNDHCRRTAVYDTGDTAIAFSYEQRSN